MKEERRMKKQLLRILLSLCMVYAVAGGAAFTQSKTNSTAYNESDVTWLGSETEYKKTLEAFFDSGLRVVPVGDFDSRGNLINAKYGLVDYNGVWAAQPVYDKIEAYYWNYSSTGRLASTNQDKSTEAIFVNGYVQAVRNGKMGLLDSTGKEVIPCKYDAVGLPSEGVCRIIVDKYIGYWNLELGREIVAPDKYVLPTGWARNAAGCGWESNEYDFIAYDFHDGYALVNTGKTKELTFKKISGLYGKPKTYSESGLSTVTLHYAQIIDKNGKEILPQAYPYNPKSKYPQAGPYMVFYDEAKEMLHMRSDAGDDIMFESYPVSGVAGKTGIVLPAKYHGGIWGNAATGWYLQDTGMKVIPELSMVITSNGATKNLREGGLPQGVVNFAGKTIIPFSNDTKYNPVEKVFVRDDAIYSADGKIISGTETKVTNRKNGYTQIFKSNPVNGYVVMTEGVIYYDKGENKTEVKSIVSVKKGTVFNNKNLLGIAASDVSTRDTLWVNKGTKTKPKWGLVSVQGRSILPFEYDEINTGSVKNVNYKCPAWTRAENAFALVKKDGKWGMIDASGKSMLPCSYRKIKDIEMNYYISIQDAASGKWGVYSLKAGKVTIPCQYNGDVDITFRDGLSGSINGVVAQPGSGRMNALLDLDTGRQLSEGLQGLKAARRGLFASNTNYYGPDGKILYPAKFNTDCTLVVRDGKVGYINASNLVREGKILSDTTTNKPATPPVGKGELKQVTIGVYPDKKMYRVGEGFDTTGLLVNLKYTNGEVTKAADSDLTFFTSDGVQLTQGSPLKDKGQKTIKVLYQGSKKYYLAFGINVIDKSDGNILSDGKYYLKIYGKYLYPVNTRYDLPVELSDKKPDYPFAVKLVSYDAAKGPCYDITYNGGAAWGVTKDAERFRFGFGGVDPTSPKWRIDQYPSFCTIRLYKNQKLLINASGQQSANGTKVIVWSDTGATPDNAKIIFIKGE